MSILLQLLEDTTRRVISKYFYLRYKEQPGKRDHFISQDSFPLQEQVVLVLLDLKALDIAEEIARSIEDKYAQDLVLKKVQIRKNVGL